MMPCPYPHQQTFSASPTLIFGGFFVPLRLLDLLLILTIFFVSLLFLSCPFVFLVFSVLYSPIIKRRFVNRTPKISAINLLFNKF
jgi:hypothetical protein